MQDKWESKEGDHDLGEVERIGVYQCKTKAIEIVYGVKIKLFGDCHDRSCRGRYDLTGDFFSRKNGSASFARNCFTANPLAKGPKRISPIFDGRLCWQELKYRMEVEDNHGLVFGGQFWKVKQLRERMLQFIRWKSEEIKEKHQDVFYSVVMNYGNLVEAFRDIGQKYKVKWVDYDEMIERLVEAGLSDYYIGWITGSCLSKIEKRKKNKGKKTT